MRSLSLALALLLVGGALAIACGNGANSVDVCQELETLRCERAPACGIDLSYPPHEGNSTTDDVTACKLYYQDACLHGLATSVTPTGQDVPLCEKAISTSCPAVLAPETNPACAWLVPPVVVDAGVDTGVTDATTPVTDVVVVTPPVDTGVIPTDAPEESTCDESCNANCVDDPVCSMACGC